MFITQRGLLTVFQIQCRLCTPKKAVIHSKYMIGVVRQKGKTDVLCNKHNVSNLILRCPFGHKLNHKSLELGVERITFLWLCPPVFSEKYAVLVLFTKGLYSSILPFKKLVLCS